MLTGIMKIKLGACLDMPTKRLHKLLATTVRDLNRAKNGMLRTWVRWHEDHPTWERAQKRDDAGSLRFTKDGKPIVDSPLGPDVLMRAMYERGTKEAPNVAAKVVSAGLQDVTKWLAGNMPYNHPGEAKTRHEAIRQCEISPPSYRSEIIYVPKQDAILCYEGHASCTLSKGISAHVEACGNSSAVLRFPLLSRASGYEVLGPTCRIEVCQLRAGNRRLLKRLAARELDLCDSKIICKGGTWSWLMAYHVPVIDHGLNAENVAVLTPASPDSRWPFEFRSHDGDKWMLGHGTPLVAEYTRLVIRRKAIRHRYKDGSGRGHGKSGFYRSLRPYSRAWQDMRDRFVKLLVADIIKQCVVRNCGALHYREPTVPLRTKLWFDARGIPFDWTLFAGRLKFKLEQHGIRQVKTKQIGMKQHQEEYGWEKVASARDEREPPKSSTNRGRIDDRTM